MVPILEIFIGLVSFEIGVGIVTSISLCGRRFKHYIRKRDRLVEEVVEDEVF